MKSFAFCLAFVLGLMAQPVAAGVLKIELPPETASFKPGPGSEIANAQCLICHSVEYVAVQPPLGRPLWTATVKKMREKYAAPITDEQVEPLLNYLSAYYGVETTNPAPAAAGGPASTASAATTGEAVVAKYGCLGCHNLDARINGPAYKEVAAKYRQDPKAVAQIAAQIHKGGSGKWGPNLMPPFPMVTDAEIKTVAAWILDLK